VKVFAELMLHINSALNIPSQLPHPSVPAAPPSAHHPWGSKLDGKIMVMDDI